MRTNLNVAVSSYVGNGNDNRLLNNLFSFPPDLVIIKGGANNGYMKTRGMGMGSSVAIASASAYETDAIKLLVNGGFVLGTNVGVNENGTTYYVLAIQSIGAAKDYFKVLKYFGTGGDDRNLNALNFDATPDFFLEKGNTTQTGAMRTTSIVGDSTPAIGGSIMQANCIQALIENGVQLGTSARSNSNNVQYNGFIGRALSGVFAYGTFVGTGAIKTVATSFGLDWMLLKNGDASKPLLMKLSSMVANETGSLNNSAMNNDMITAFGTTGFTVGTLDYANGSGHNIYWIGGKAGNFLVPPTRSLI